ncbi:MAG: UDP-3-O-[3-hydroxymyristoyl] N-acetylglucosamine deacetylase [Candidatus Lambdaproteobacteria bacterium RIFOXYD1_FULL_56_27]|uniref:UDP-3-O-acyl-N-acetylglucosamine deacetylase n=1 Tax=Candidatus Lambdaproteobacteria bacterium RIFOXYD2_FULL_56_26 TaxID=1817773 RepID=A0A1F6GPK3_9PROT|nr:MAG: UDP-3-O-[3-hydroxymyristoyl] N-acetylglucosamine deacetylase [Candidatus Lambdaproteobacteria bacterium RIFOXYD2_FULL_56_26]OGH03826.1 MAG: UDP-3-O-[3-hydroxymyristoyl] N-acetylglucosamine deacetylase [Candidatus Lambdaproteobacteria bacterium RIFOXYC1_FULL_56_13]OGH06225.1 MAG: UDP-3-O-[3-hydroxymyristoyl] N-acetylglucosamine deacetylase [Candidatus Lambdaproteobacteria bacterium RIFOXYD1_FULL_56_27]
MNQTTLKESLMITGGVGLHSGQPTRVVFYPAEAGEGVVFHRLDQDVKIPATYQYAKSSPLCTTLQKDGVILQTVEHLLSVCSGMGIDNLLVELESEEVPILDGSGYEFFKRFSEVGLRELAAPKQGILVKKPVLYQKGDIEILATPSANPVFSFAIDFAHQQLGQQEYHFQFTEAKYAEEIVRAKTFCLERDVETLQAKGLIKGGSEENAIILGEDGQFKNMEVLTWLNEPNLHKILDQIGDFYLARNLRILGNVHSHKSGHSSHLEFIRLLMEDRQDAWELVEL